MSGSNSLTQKSEVDLAERVRELEAELAEVRAREAKASEVRKKATRAGGGLVKRLVLGPEIEPAAIRWIEAVNRNRRNEHFDMPPGETANLGTAILRRIVRIGGLGILVAILGLVVSAVPSFLQFESNRLFRDQMTRQFEDTEIVRRAQLLDTLYAAVCPEPPLRGGCIPVASARARKEAALAFVEIESASGRIADLSSAYLGGADLRSADLRSVNLGGADLRGANLGGARLGGAYLSRADLSEAFLAGADLRGADLRGADLGGARLGGAILNGANLMIADLSGASLGKGPEGIGGEILAGVGFNIERRGADLGGAILAGTKLSGANISEGKLSQDQIDQAFGDESTILPEGLTRPPDWLEDPVTANP